MIQKLTTASKKNDMSANFPSQIFFNSIPRRHFQLCARKSRNYKYVCACVPLNEWRGGKKSFSSIASVHNLIKDIMLTQRFLPSLHVYCCCIEWEYFSILLLMMMMNIVSRFYISIFRKAQNQ